MKITMNIPESPYQRLIDIIDAILIKNESSQKPEITLYPSDVPSLPQSSHGINILGEFLNALKQKGIIFKLEDSLNIVRLARDVKSGHLDSYNAVVYKFSKLDEAAEQKLLAEREVLYRRTQIGTSSNEEKISLADHQVRFDNKQAVIFARKRICELPPDKNEHAFCRAMFTYKRNEPVDWSLIHNHMTGNEDDIPDKKFKRTVQDAMYTLNQRIKDDMNTDDDLFTWRITNEIYNKKLKEYTEKLTDLEIRMGQHTQADESFYMNAKTLLFILKKSCDVFKGSEPATKRQILNFLLQNCKLDGKKLNFELKTPFDRVLQATTSSNMLPG